MREFESTRFGLGTPRYPSRVEASQPASVDSHFSSVDPWNTPTRFTTTTTPSPKRRPLQGLQSESFTHILEEVFSLGPDSILEQALREKGCENHVDLIHLLICLDTNGIDSLQYPRDQGPDQNERRSTSTSVISRSLRSFGPPSWSPRLCPLS